MRSFCRLIGTLLICDAKDEFITKVEFALLGTIKEWSYHDVTEEHRLLIEALGLCSTSNKHKQQTRDGRNLTFFG